jgi:septal ring factor EnvC (AmiA/AmiB activator)
MSSSSTQKFPKPGKEVNIPLNTIENFLEYSLFFFLLQNKSPVELPEQKIQRLEGELLSQAATINDLTKRNEELQDLIKKYINTIDWMEKKIKQLEDDLNREKAKSVESDSSNSLPLIKK